MMEIRAKHNTANVMTDNIEEACISQLYNLMNLPHLADSNIVVQPDCHAGKGCVVGFTQTFNDYVCPNLVGVDIGCGMDAFNLGQVDINLDVFDDFLRDQIPSGFNTNAKIQKKHMQSKESQATLRDISEMVKRIDPKLMERTMNSIGTLGGGNHFIEMNRDDDNNVWLVVHSGSRNLGLQVCKYHQNVAKEYIKREFNGAGAYKDCEYMPLDEGGSDYLRDMDITQRYASLNREVMCRVLIDGFFRMSIKDLEHISSIHNYVNLDDRILRKGAIAAHEGQRVIIPLNMRDGSIIATGKGNKDWNYSAPHGAGRIMSRSKAKKTLSMEDYQESMKGIFTTSVSAATLDEAPMTYKPADEIIDAIGDTVDIDFVMKPIYNYKDSTVSKQWGKK